MQQRGTAPSRRVEEHDGRLSKKVSLILKKSGPSLSFFASRLRIALDCR